MQPIAQEKEGRSATLKRGGRRSQEGRREDRVRAAPAVSRAKAEKKTHTSIQVQRKQSGLPCAVVYGLLRALLGDRAFCHRHQREISRRLDASVEASGPHDFAVRIGAVRQGHLHVHRIPHPTFVTTAKRPSCGHETTEICTDLRIRKIRIFFEKGWTEAAAYCPSDLPVGSFFRTSALL